MKSHKNKNLLPPRQFAKRILIYTFISLLMLTFSLGMGILGYKFIGGLNWVDSLYNASMILTGMGPIDPMKTVEAKLFASFYALFSGVVFLSTVAVFFAPFAHRLKHLLRVKEINMNE